MQCSAAQCDGNWKQSEGSPVDRAGLFWLLESSRLKLYPLYSLNCTAVQWCSVHSTALPVAVQQSEFSHSIHRICCRKVKHDILVDSMSLHGEKRCNTKKIFLKNFNKKNGMLSYMYFENPKIGKCSDSLSKIVISFKS